MIPDATVQMRRINIDKLRRMKQEAEIQIDVINQGLENSIGSDPVIIEIVVADYLFLLSQLETP